MDQISLCRQCALKGHTCCQNHDIYVTQGDCRRISIHTGQNDFFEYRTCSDSAYADQDDDPVWQKHVFRPDGSRRVLKRNGRAECLFLTSAGCQLPLTVRPLVCRLFPHLYSDQGLYNQWDSECLAAQGVSENAIESGIDGVAQSEARIWHALLYKELRWEGLIDDAWIGL